jgi:putative glutamine amidotransferase
MKKCVFFGLFPFLLAVVAGFAAQPHSGTDDHRYLDSAPDARTEIRLAVFNPSVFTLRALSGLMKHGLLDVSGLTVVGLYHAKEKTDYEESRTHAAENGIDWIRFHELEAEVPVDALYGQNDWTPVFEAVVRKTDGVIFFGGPDLPPSLYDRKTHLLTVIQDPWRHFLEASAAFHFLGGFQDESFEPLLVSRPQFAVLGICLGLQTLNGATGGTLVQDIWMETYGVKTFEDAEALGREQWHNNPHIRLHPASGLTGYNFHALRLEKDGIFVRVMELDPAFEPRILSSHHQAADKLGKGWVVAARSRDGRVVEALEHSVFPNVLAVQFHPEHPLLWEDEPTYRFSPDDPEPISYKERIEETAGSPEFHRKIWHWFGTALKESFAALDKSRQIR